MKPNEHEEETHEYSSRATNIGYLTHEHDQIQQKIDELILKHDLKIHKLIDVCCDHPRIKQEFNLMHQIFLRNDLVQDIIRFLFVPRRMMNKYELNQDQGRKFVSTIKNFLTENNQFYEHFFLGAHNQRLNFKIWFQFLDNNKDDVFNSALSNLNDILIPIIKYQYSSSSRICQFFQNDSHENAILILNYFSQSLIERLISFTSYYAVFQVLFNLIIVSLEEQEWRISLIVLQKLFRSAINQQPNIEQKYKQTLDTHIYSMYTMITEVSNNISKDKHNTIFAFTNVIYQTKFLCCCINRLHNIIQKYFQGDKNQQLPQQLKQSLQFNLKCISQIINIYYLLRKNGIDEEVQQMKKTKKSIIHLFNQFPTLLILFNSNQYTTFRMSNGENIKPLSLYKYQLFNLIKISLQLIKDYGQNSSEFILNVEKVQLLELSIKYLTEYRWNNILHCVLQKIISLTISREMFKIKSISIHKILDYLVQSFINKKFIFLNSMRMTNQGNLHFIYNVSCLISLQLQKAYTFYDISNPYEEWNIFMKTLEKYEDKHKKYKQSQFITDQQIKQSERNEKYGLKVEIDELVSIKQIIEKRQIYAKWRPKDKKQHQIHKDLNRTSNSAKNAKSSSLQHYKHNLQYQGIRRKSLLRQQYITQSNKVQKKFSSSDGFAKQLLKKTISQNQQIQFNQSINDLDLSNNQ